MPDSLRAGVALLALLVLAVVCADLVAPFDPLEQSPTVRLSPPSMEHPLGTDAFGRDILSRVLYGGRFTLTASFAALSAALCLGVCAGMAAGILGGLCDAVLMRIVDVLMAFPFTVLALVVTALFGTGFLHLLFAVAAVWWVPFARLHAELRERYRGRGGPCPRGKRPHHCRPRDFAEGDRTRMGPRDVRAGETHPFPFGPVLLRPRGETPFPGVGNDAGGRQGTLLQGPSPPAGAGALHLSDGAVPEPDGGRAEGPTGPVRDPRILTGGADGKYRGKNSREALIKTKSHILPGINMQNIYGQKYPALP